MGEINSTTSTAAHVAVLAFPFGSHATPLLAVTIHLASAAPHTLFSFFTTSKSKNALISEHSNLQDNVKFYDVSDGVPQNYNFTGNHEEVIEFFMKAAPDGFRNGMKAAAEETGRELTCMLTDAFLWFSAIMAKEMGVSWLPLWTSGAATLSCHVYTDLIRKTIGNEGFVGHEDQPLTFIAGLSKILLRDLPEGIVFGDLDSFFSCMLYQMSEMLPYARAVLVNSFEELNPTSTDDLKSKFNKVLTISPLNFETSSPPEPPSMDSSGCIAWLDRQKVSSVAYIGFGSFAVPPPNELVAIAEALETSGVPFMWSLGDSSKVHLPEGFLSRTEAQGMVVPWAPQVQVLGHPAVGVFITHCGWNSLLETIAAQVPMICRPFIADHKLNAGFTERVWEIGVIVEGGVFTKTALTNSLDVLLNQAEGKRLREKAKALKKLAEVAVGSDGSSNKSFQELVEIVTTPKQVSSA